MEHFFPLPNSLFCPRSTGPTLTLLLLCTLPSVHCPVRRATGGGRRRRRPHSNYFFSLPILAPPSPRGDITREKRKKERGSMGFFPSDILEKGLCQFQQLTFPRGESFSSSPVLPCQNLEKKNTKNPRRKMACDREEGNCQNSNQSPRSPASPFSTTSPSPISKFSIVFGPSSSSFAHPKSSG